VTELLWLYDLGENKVSAIDNPADFEIEEQLQASEILRFRVQGDDPRADFLGEDRLIGWAGRYFRTTELTFVREEQQTWWQVGADARWIDLLGYPAALDMPAGATISDGAAKILAHTSWDLGTVESDGGSFTLQPSLEDTALSALRAWATMTNRELEFDTATQTVNIVVEQGEDRGLGFRYGRNLISVKRRAEPVVATRIYPIGKDGLTPALVNPTGKAYIDNFTWYTDQGVPLPVAETRYVKAQVWQDDRYINATNLLDTGTRRLASLAKPRITYEATAIDLSALPGMSALEVYLIGDTCIVWDGPSSLRIRTRIVRKIDRPLEPWNSQVELGFMWRPNTASTGGGSGGGAGDTFNMLVDLNGGPITVGSGLTIMNQVNVVVTSNANLIFASNLDGTATGTGTITVTYWYGTDQVGPKVKYDFVAGSVHIAVPDFLIGLKANRIFYCKAQVTTGSGTVTFPTADGAHLYIAGAGLLAGTIGSSDQDIAEPVTYLSNPTETVTPLFLTPIGSTVTETVGYLTDPTETVTQVRTP
jgi:phage minor structural protein